MTDDIDDATAERLFRQQDLVLDPDRAAAMAARVARLNRVTLEATRPWTTMPDPFLFPVSQARNARRR